MSTQKITEVLEFLLEKIANGQLVKADITASKEGRSEASVGWANLVTEFEASNRIKKSLDYIVEELDYEDASRAVHYLTENFNEIMKSNPSIKLTGMAWPNHVSIINQSYTQTFHIDRSEKDKSHHEKFEYLIHYLKYFVRHILATNTINSSGISKVTFARTIFPHTNFFNDLISIFYNNGEIETEQFTSNDIGSPHKAPNFYSGLFADLHIKLELQFTGEGQYDISVIFSDSNGNIISLLGEEPISDEESSTSLNFVKDETDLGLDQYHITGDIFFNRFS